MIVAIIPARGGSKRIPRKNIKDFLGKPMIQYSIMTCLKSNLFDYVYVSSDDDEILELSETLGVKTLKRSADLANDVIPIAPVMSDAISTIERTDGKVKFACSVFPCAPFIKVSDLKHSYDELLKTNSLYVYPVTNYPHPIQRAIKVVSGNVPEFIEPKNQLVTTQSFEDLFHDTGQFYFGTRDAWMSEQKMHTDGIVTKIPNWRAVDIDTFDDWKRAELLYRLMIELGELS